MSSLMKWILVAVLATTLNSSVSYAAASVKGTGVYRSERDCLRQLPAFNRKLQAMGLTLTKATECEEVLGQEDAYAPAFEGVADRELAAETAVAGIFESREGCETNLRAMLSVVAGENEAIIESACVPVSIVDQESDELRTGQFQPMVVLLKTR